MVKNITLETLQQLCLEITVKTFCIADLGCSSGSNTLAMIKDIVETVEGTCRKILLSDPQFHVHLNDLSTNDFNSVFKALPDFYRELRKERSGGRPHIYVGGYPGSFYGRLFPNNSLHFIYASYSLHWLSKVRFFSFDFITTLLLPIDSMKQPDSIVDYCENIVYFIYTVHQGFGYAFCKPKNLVILCLIDTRFI